MGFTILDKVVLPDCRGPVMAIIGNFSNNSTINYNLPPEILSLLLENQKNITQSIAQQNEFLQSLLVKK